jgi:hypothetical protein
VVAETIQGETVVIHLDTGCYYSLRGSAAALWDLLAAGHAEPELAALLTGRFDADPDTVLAAARGFRDRLLAEQLLAPRAPDEAAAPAAAGMPSREPFAPPVLEKYDDMQDLLLADPIHDVEETGWPHRPGDAARP